MIMILLLHPFPTDRARQAEDFVTVDGILIGGK